ncbi:MAG TPA: response regulator transcription factor [Spirochaetia bacterium]|nr:response regulator transcription factor [Spirochaetia bacterium]
MVQKSILLIDDHNLFREGLKTIIRRDSQFTVVAEAKNADEGVRAALRARPDIVLLDISLPGRSGIDVAREIRGKLPETLIIIVSMFSRPDLVMEAVEAGARGYVTKGSTPETLLQAIRSVAEGQFYLDGAASQELITALENKGSKGRTVINNEYGQLSSREQEVLRMIAEGVPARDIAERLFISVKTVENHRTNILHKLGLKSTVDLVKYAARIGLIDVETWKG